MRTSVSLLSQLRELERNFTWWRHRLRDRWRLRRTYARCGIPVVVYSMPKTASMAVYRALHKRNDVLALKSHVLLPAHWRRRRHDPAWKPGWKGCWRDYWHSDVIVDSSIIRPGKPCRFIALVRDPVATNISAFHYFLSNWIGEESTLEEVERASSAELERIFFERYPHHMTTEWFDLEPKAVLGIDVYNSQFSHENKCQVYRRGPFELLVMRIDLDDEGKAARIREFLGIKDVTIRHINTMAEHGLCEQRDEMRRRISAHPEYVDQLLGSKYARHFWTDAERAQMRHSWCGRG